MLKHGLQPQFFCSNQIMCDILHTLLVELVDGRMFDVLVIDTPWDLDSSLKWHVQLAKLICLSASLLIMKPHRKRTTISEMLYLLLVVRMDTILVSCTTSLKLFCLMVIIWCSSAVFGVCVLNEQVSLGRFVRARGSLTFPDSSTSVF